MKSSVVIHSLFVALWSVFGPSFAWAAITWTGAITPSTPTAWGSGTGVQIGRTSDGGIAVHGGSTLLSGSALLGFAAGSTGEVTVTGTGSHWINSGQLTVGNNGDGVLSIQAGGTVTNTRAYLGDSTGSGQATVTGAGSQWINSDALYVGRVGTGTLRVDDGGHVVADTLFASLTDLQGDGTIAVNGAVIDGNLAFDATHGLQVEIAFGSGGVLTVMGTGGVLGAGYKGAGTLAVADGMTVNSVQGNLGLLAGSNGEASVTGNGSKWINSGQLSIGNSGDGALSIQAGATVANVLGVLGNKFGSSGAATVTGPGSLWSNTNYLMVGGTGSGVLTVQASGKVTNTNGYVGCLNGSAGEAMVTGAGSQWRNSGELAVGYLGSGELTISSGALVSVALALSVDERMIGDSFVNLSTGGMLALASDETGDDSLANFLARVRGTKAIRYWDSANSIWADLTTATYGADYTLEYLSTGDLAGYTILTVGEAPPPLPGDYNADGVLDAADYTVWRDNLGGPAGTLPNDVDGGEIGAAQYDTWRTNYGSAVSPNTPATNNAVPEPSGAMLALAGLAAVGFARRSAVITEEQQSIRSRGD